MTDALLRTDLPFPVRRGKVRDIYDLGNQQLLIVATDRISAFDCVMTDGIPEKGILLTAISIFWFEMFQEQFDNHLIAHDVDQYPLEVQEYREQLWGRSMLVRKADVVPIECVARGYLAGSGWKEYQTSGRVCGVNLPGGLQQCGELPDAIFTPATKAESGHDINISYEEAAMRVGESLTMELRDRTLSLYTQAAKYAATRGIIIADTKFEFGLLPNGNVILVDEVLTPDSSRFWPANNYAAGRDQPSFDKQYVRNYLEKLDWNKTAPAPSLPPDVVEGTRQRYLEAYKQLTGKKLEL